jgi:hypothetical protein
MRTSAGLAVAGAFWIASIAGCGRAPQDLPVVVSADPDDGALQWSDAHGPLRGEVPWVVRSDLRGPDTALVVETPTGAARARRVSFRVLAGGATEYRVVLVADDSGRVSWTVRYGEGQRMRLFSCDPRPADDPKLECLHGGVPRPLFGTLVGEISAELEDGRRATDVEAIRFERPPAE